MGSDGAESSGENSDLANGDANATIYAQAMADLKEALLRNQLTKKVSVTSILFLITYFSFLQNFTSNAPESIKHLKQAYLTLKANSQLKANQMIIKTSVFDVPREVWRSGFNAFQMDNQTIPFTDYAQ